MYQEAIEIQKEGYNCSETVIEMAGRYYLPEIDFCYSNLVTGFGGGMGRSRAETCGALNGSIIALSMLIGRDNPSVDVDPIHEKISEFRKFFLAEFNNSVCHKLREGYEADEAKNMCHEMTAKTVMMLFEYFESLGIKRKV